MFLTLNITHQFFLSLGFFLLSPFLCPPSAMGIEEGRNWGEKCSGKNPQLLLWQNLADLAFTSRTWCFCSSCSLCPCIFMLFSFPVGIFLLFLMQQTSVWFFFLFCVCSPVCSNCHGVSLLLDRFLVFFNLLVPKKWIIKGKKQSPLAVSLQIMQT